MRPGQHLRQIIADRWWSVRTVIRYALADGVHLLCWARASKSIRTALAALAEDDPRWQPLPADATAATRGAPGTQGRGYWLETELTVYGLTAPVWVIVEWDGHPSSPKRARLAIGLPTTDVSTAAACAQLRDRQRLEILLKLLQRRQHRAHFSGGPVLASDAEPTPLTADLRLETQRRQVTTRRAHAQARRQEAQATLEALATGAAQPGVLGLGLADLRSLRKRLTEQVQRADQTLARLNAQLAPGQTTLLAPAPYAALDLAQESLLSQLKLERVHRPGNVGQPVH